MRYVRRQFDKLLKGLRISSKDVKRLTLKQWLYPYYRAYRVARGHDGVFAEAEDAVMRRKTGWDKTNPTWEETCSALTDSRQPHQKDAALDSQSKSEKFVKNDSSPGYPRATAKDGLKTKPTWEETCNALTDSRQSHQKDAALDSQSKSENDMS